MIMKHPSRRRGRRFKNVLSPISPVECPEAASDGFAGWVRRGWPGMGSGRRGVVPVDCSHGGDGRDDGVKEEMKLSCIFFSDVLINEDRY